MSRPRIRSIKPETWQDERVHRLSREARLLLVVLITMADDEGRVAASPVMILGHGYPYDEDAPRKLPKWLAELEHERVVLRYTHDRKPYIAFRNWRRHQKINRATDSQLPAPPDRIVVAENAIPAKDESHDSISEPITEPVVNGSRSAHGTSVA